MGRISNITNTEDDLKVAFRVFDRVETAQDFMPTSELRYVLEYLAENKLIENQEVNECLDYFEHFLFFAGSKAWSEPCPSLPHPARRRVSLLD